MRYALLITCLLSLGAKPYYGLPKDIDYCPPSARSTVHSLEAGLPRPAVVSPPAVERAPIQLPSYVMPSYMRTTQQIIQRAQAYQQGPRGQAYQTVIPAQWIANRHRSCTGGL